MTKSTGQRCRRQATDDDNLFDVLASRSEDVGDCIVYMEQPSDDRPRVSYNGVMTRAYVAVYMHVHGGVPEGLGVLHSCNVSRCWNPMHLYAGTKVHNALDSIDAGTHVAPTGENHGNHRFTAKEIADMRKLFSVGMKIAELARAYDTNRGTMSHIVHMQTRKVS